MTNFTRMIKPFFFAIEICLVLSSKPFFFFEWFDIYIWDNKHLFCNQLNFYPFLLQQTYMQNIDHNYLLIDYL